MTDISEQLRQLVLEKATAAVELASEAIVQQLEQRVVNEHYVTGELFDSLFLDSITVEPDSIYTHVGASADQASWTDTGTDAHAIVSHGPWSLHNAETGEYFGREVWHPGYEGSLWFSDTTREENWSEQLQIAFDLGPS